MTSDQLLIVIAVGLVVIYLVLEKNKKPNPPPDTDDQKLINDPLLPVIDLRGWNFEQRGNKVGFFGEDLRDFPTIMSSGSFTYRMKTNEGEHSINYLIEGWTLENSEFPGLRKYYSDPLLINSQGIKHVIVY